MPSGVDPRASDSLRAFALIVVAVVLTTSACGEHRPAAGADSSAGHAPALAAGEQAALHRLPEGTGRELLAANCLTCHGTMMIEQQHKDSAAWNKTISTMVAWGSPLPPAQQPVLVAYLAQHFPARGDVAPPARTAP